MSKDHILGRFLMFYVHMHVEDIPSLEHDNEDLYMDDNIDNNMHQLMRNHNKDHRFDMVVKHIEI
jgi:hypothetical protein